MMDALQIDLLSDKVLSQMIEMYSDHTPPYIHLTCLTIIHGKGSLDKMYAYSKIPLIP